MSSDFSDYVKHPRYGRGPRLTGLNPKPLSGSVYLHWQSGVDSRIPDTAIAADCAKQGPCTFNVTHYFDLKRTCADCEKPFIFFAAEQKYWYEVLGFGLDAGCIRCVPCRKKQQGIDLYRQRYEELFHIPNRTQDQSIEIAECCLSLVEASEFGKRKLEYVRSILNKMPETTRTNKLRQRVRIVEAA